MHDELPSAGLKELVTWLLRRRKRLVVTGASMEPTLHAGDVVLVDSRAHRTRQVREGELVVAAHPRRADLRIVKRVEFLDGADRCYLSSDNRTDPDASDSRTFGFVQTSEIFGTVTSVLRR